MRGQHVKDPVIGRGDATRVTCRTHGGQELGLGHNEARARTTYVVNQLIARVRRVRPGPDSPRRDRAQCY